MAFGAASKTAQAKKTAVLPGDYFQRLARPPLSQNPHTELDKLRGDGLVRISTGEVVLGRHADVDLSLRDPRFVRPALPPAPVKAVRTLTKMFLLRNPPDHARLRGAVAPFFTASEVKQRRDQIEHATAAIIDRRLEASDQATPIDIVNEFAYPLSLGLICGWLGVSGEREAEVGVWARDLTAALDAPVPSSLRHMPVYLRALVRRRARPIATTRLAQRMVGAANAALDARPDASALMTLLTAAQADGSMTRDEAAATWVLLVIAGHETSANLIANTLYLLLQHPDQLDRVTADTSLIPAAIEESLRLEAVVPTTARLAVEDVDLPSGRIAAGTVAVASIAAANRDPEIFDDPNRFDIDRDQHGNLGFGRGVHHCLGIHFARLEAEIALGHLLARGPHLAGDVRWRDTFGTRGLDSLPVAFRTHRDTT